MSALKFATLYDSDTYGAVNSRNRLLLYSLPVFISFFHGHVHNIARCVISGCYDTSHMETKNNYRTHGGEMGIGKYSFFISHIPLRSSHTLS